jgi:hypothetical protein
MYEFQVGSRVVLNSDDSRYPEVLTVGTTRFLNSHLMRFAFRGHGMRREWSKNVRHATVIERIAYRMRRARHFFGN